LELASTVAFPRVGQQTDIALRERIELRFQADQPRLQAQQHDAQQRARQCAAERTHRQHVSQPLQRPARHSPSRNEQTLFQPPPHRVTGLHRRHRARQPAQPLLPRADRPRGGRRLAQQPLEAPARRACERAERVLARETVEPLGQQ